MTNLLCGSMEYKKKKITIIAGSIELDVCIYLHCTGVSRYSCFGVFGEIIEFL